MKEFESCQLSEGAPFAMLVRLCMMPAEAILDFVAGQGL